MIPSIHRRAIVFGEALIDVYPDATLPAGAPLHVAAGLSSCGWTVKLITRIGRDAAGSSILRTIRQYKIATSYVERDSKLNTGRVLISFKNGEPTYSIDELSAWDAIKGPSRLPAHEVFYYGSLSARSPQSRKALERLLRISDAAHVFDANLRPPFYSKHTCTKLMQYAHVVKMNAAELHTLARQYQFPAKPQQYFKAFPLLELLAITRDIKGSSLYNRQGDVLYRPASGAKIIDTVGAGDAYTAGMIDGLWHDMSYVSERAHKAAKKALSVSGGLPSFKDQNN